MESIKSFLENWDILGLTIGAIISLLVGLVYKGIKNFVTMKRRPYNISRQIVSRTVYDNRQEGDFTITVSYKGSVYEETLTMVRMRLLNDGMNDINFITQCSGPLRIEVTDAAIVDFCVEPSVSDIGASLALAGEGKYVLSWKLLKKDEYIDLVAVVKGKDFMVDQIHTSIRAEGISKIKSPEYHVWPQLWPVLLANLLCVVLCWFTMPKEITFIPYIPQNIFWAGLFALLMPIYIIMVLVKRIQWQKE